MTTKSSEPELWEAEVLTTEELLEIITVALDAARKIRWHRLNDQHEAAQRLFLSRFEAGLEPLDAAPPKPDFPARHQDIELPELEAQVARDYAIEQAKKAQYWSKKRHTYWQQVGKPIERVKMDRDELHQFIQTVRAPELGLQVTHNNHSEVLYQALLCYHTGDQEGLIRSIRAFDREVDGKLKNPYCANPAKLSIDKGIALLGNPGTGKTTLMRLFIRNPAMSYHCIRAKTLENLYNQHGEEALREYYGLMTAKGMPKYYLGQTHLGLCIEDVGTEDMAIKFSRAETVALVTNERYERYFLSRNFVPFYATHFTSNLTLKALRERYGDRFYDRMRESFNVLLFPPETPSRRETL